jgi:hypothetical protein
MFVAFITKDKQAVIQEVKRLCLTKNEITFCDIGKTIYFESPEEARNVFGSIGRAIEQGKPFYSITQEVTL